MNEQILMDGEPLNVGDPVYCLLRGEGNVISLTPGFFSTISVDFGVNVYHYTNDFKPRGNSPIRTLFWQKPTIIPPPKPKKKLKVGDWFVKWVGGGVSIEKGLTENQFNDSVVAIKQKIEGTEREIEQ